MDVSDMFWINRPVKVGFTGLFKARQRVISLLQYIVKLIRVYTIISLVLSLVICLLTKLIIFRLMIRKILCPKSK